ncbi:MAG: carbohydrate kinase family protein [Patescibacteria group bacterium]|nr:MAG: carbohydrate kinase family protein [Patescibacteria group bacterium]
MQKRKKPSAYDVISIGDATLDVFVSLQEANVLCNLQKDVCQLCLSYADKIPVEKVQRLIGGNAANNAVGSSRLGLTAAFYSIVGNDETGRNIMETIQREKVCCEYVQVDKKQESNYSVVLNYKGERTILVYHIDRKYKMPKFKPTKWFYLTSMGKNHMDFHMALLAHVKKTRAQLAFNPGTHQLKQGLEKLKPLLASTAVLFVNKEEAQRLVGTIADMKELLIATKRIGPKIVVITDGEKGSYVHDGVSFWKCGITDTAVVERTGAGDSFATAFIAAMNLGKDIPEALRWGTMNSGSVILKVGPQAGLLTKGQMQSWLKKYPSIKAQTF